MEMNHNIVEFQEGEFQEIRDLILHPDSIKTNPRTQYDVDHIDGLFVSAIENSGFDFEIRYEHFYSLVNDEETIIGALKIEPNSPMAEISFIDLFLKASLRKDEKHMILQSVFQLLKSNFKIKKIFISVLNKNIRALDLLNQSAMTIEGHLKGAIWNEGEMNDEIIFGLEL